jgi:1,4-dihydroxy-2-naphthoate octaprenyltransferase
MLSKEQNNPEMVKAIKFGKTMFVVSLILSFALLIIYLLIFHYQNEWSIMLIIAIIWIAFNFVYGTILRENYFWFGAIYLFLIGALMIITGIYFILLSKISNNFLVGTSIILLAAVVILIAFSEYKQLVKALP